MPFVSPLTPHRQQRQLQMQRQRYAVINQSPAGALTVPQSDAVNHNSYISPRTASNAQSSHVSTFTPDPILYDSDPPPYPSQSGTMTQEQHDYLDQLITDFVILGMLIYSDTIA